MTWAPNAATLRLQAIKAGKTARESETKPAKGETITGQSGKKSTKNETKPAKSGQKGGHSGKKPNKKRIKQVSKRRAKQNRKYRKLRDAYLEKHPHCQIPVEGCTGVATQVHHGEGRENERLLDVSKFRAACDNCHRKATDHSRQAIKDGRSGSRLKSKRNGKTDGHTDLPG